MYNMTLAVVNKKIRVSTILYLVKDLIELSKRFDFDIDYEELINYIVYNYNYYNSDEVEEFYLVLLRNFCPTMEIAKECECSVPKSKLKINQNYKFCYKYALTCEFLDFACDDLVENILNSFMYNVREFENYDMELDINIPISLIEFIYSERNENQEELINLFINELILWLKFNGLYVDLSSKESFYDSCNKEFNEQEEECITFYFQR